MVTLFDFKHGHPCFDSHTICVRSNHVILLSDFTFLIYVQYMVSFSSLCVILQVTASPTSVWC